MFTLLCFLPYILNSLQIIVVVFIMNLEYLMYLSSIFYFIGYLPDIYANWINKNANIYNLPERILFLIGTCLAVTYSVKINDNTLIITYVPLLAVDMFTLVMRIYYWQINKNKIAVITDGVENCD